jgi:hypothetical protein
MTSLNQVDIGLSLMATQRNLALHFGHLTVRATQTKAPTAAIIAKRSTSKPTVDGAGQ